MLRSRDTNVSSPATVWESARPTIFPPKHAPTVSTVPDEHVEWLPNAPTSPTRNPLETEPHGTQSNEQPENRSKHRRWLALLVIAALIAAKYFPALPEWFGFIILGFCVGAFVQIAADYMRLSERLDTTKRWGAILGRMLAILPVIQNVSRRVLRLNSIGFRYRLTDCVTRLCPVLRVTQPANRICD